MKNVILLFAFLMSISNSLSAQWQPTEGISGGYVYAFAASGSNIYSVINGSLFASSNSGNTWTEFVNVPPKSEFRAIVISGSSIFAGTSGKGMYLSTDNGNSWRAINSGLTKLNITSLAASGATVFAGTDDGIFVSTNNGGSWQAVNNGLPTRRYVTSLAIEGTTVFASHDGIVSKSTNNGANWTSLANGLGDSFGTPSVTIRSLFVKGNEVYASTQNGIFVLGNGSTNWAKFGLQDTTVYALAFNGTNFFAGTDKGLYVSKNGASWTSQNTGITRRTIYHFVTIGTTVVAGTYGSVFTSEFISPSITAVIGVPLTKALKM
jgi:photosystem II stability/assembly factor-like uncharacterized protein